MVHLFNNETRVLTLDQFGEDRFLEEMSKIKQYNAVYDQTNIDWWDSLPKRYKQFVDWFFLMDGDQLAAFSCIQNYYPGCYKMLTRLYIYRDYRRFTNPKNDTLYSPSMRLLETQLMYLGHQDTLMIAVQDLRKRNVLTRYINKLNNFFDYDWQLHPEMVLTCDKDWGETCWQNLIYTGSKPSLPTISIDEWKNRYG